MREGLGSEVILHILVDGKGLAAAGADGTTVLPSATITARVNAYTALNVGDTAVVTADTRHMHFFDLETDLAIVS